MITTTIKLIHPTASLQTVKEMLLSSDQRATAGKLAGFFGDLACGLKEANIEIDVVSGIPFTKTKRRIRAASLEV